MHSSQSHWTTSRSMFSTLAVTLIGQSEKVTQDVKADRRTGAAFVEVGSHKESNVLLVRVAVIGALKAGILTEVVAPIIASV